MRRIYARTRILLAPSLWEEGWGRVISEAQISGIPVLASNRGGLPESVGPGGLLVAHDAPLDRWRNALSAMWDDVDVYGQLSAAAAKHSRRPAIQPDRLLDRFAAILQAHAQGEPSTAMPVKQKEVSAGADEGAPLRAANG
jgi:glycosyltransferase involved in cell wall biosynthesis